MTAARRGCEECRGQGRIMLAFHLTDRCSLCGGDEPAPKAGPDEHQRGLDEVVRAVAALDRRSTYEPHGIVVLHAAMPTPLAPLDLWTRWRELGGHPDTFVALRVSLDLTAYGAALEAEARRLGPDRKLPDNARLHKTWWQPGESGAMEVAGGLTYDECVDVVLCEVTGGAPVVVTAETVARPTLVVGYSADNVVRVAQVGARLCEELSAIAGRFALLLL